MLVRIHPSRIKQQITGRRKSIHWGKSPRSLSASFKQSEEAEQSLKPALQRGISESTYRDWQKRTADPAYPLWNALKIADPVELGLRRQKSRPGREHSVEEIALIQQQIAEAVAAGKTIFEACRSAEIDDATYRRWLKRWPNIQANNPTAMGETEQSFAHAAIEHLIQLWNTERKAPLSNRIPHTRG